MRRSARVLHAAEVSVPDSGELAIRIITDYAVPAERAFYVRPGSPLPALGDPVSYADEHAWYGAAEVRKVG